MTTKSRRMRIGVHDVHVAHKEKPVLSRVGGSLISMPSVADIDAIGCESRPFFDGTMPT